jgi:membrane protease YdiL (CAAX protease family)
MTNIFQKYGNTKMGALVKSLLFIAFFLLLIMSSGPLGSAFTYPYNRLCYGICGIAVGYLTIWLAMQVDRNTFSSIGMNWEKQTLPRFFLGMFIGLFIFILMMVTLLSFTPIQLTYNPSFFTLSNFFIYLPIFPLAFAEELCFRSYPQVKLNNAFGTWVSQVVIAVLFGAYHVLMGWGVYAAFTGPFVWAFVFGLAALKYGGIAAPTGIHFAINVLQSLVGFKSNNALWKSSYPPGTSKAIMNGANHLGLLMQGALLICMLILTALYIKSKKNKQQTFKSKMSDIKLNSFKPEG